MKKVSVIIPVYNVEKYLSECVDSVLHQTYQNFEIILVDDGSKDKSGEICDMYASSDSRISVIHKENGGASSARNEGLRYASGDYVYFLDSDDLIKPYAFEHFVKAVDSEKADIIFFEADSFGSEGNNKDGNYHYEHKYGKGKGEEILSKLIENKEFHVSTPLLFLRHEFLKKTGITFKEGIMYEDFIYAFKLFCYAECVYHLDETLYRRRYREASVMTRRKSNYNFISAATVYYELIDFSLLTDISEKSFFKIHVSRMAMNCLNIYGELNKNDKQSLKDSLTKLKNSIKENKAFGNKSLYFRCYGYFSWVAYKLFEKTIGRFF